MNPTDCLEIVTLVKDYDVAARIFELIEKNYGSNVSHENVTVRGPAYIHSVPDTKNTP